ncbi:hypothetical protein BK634_10730 [Pseudomonas chlororaphis]|uniref:Uncharacterized protein n=1 Tax=Pseudomonas morbosilactucae TaxID=2938197 RepID=A0A9X1Z0J9_9PSED|nr:hypothetical protein [Pseudomonas morbosilactucae]ROL68278.1 hypothetical protein BK634_10730 [Pseudomonas chlororaphis]
MNEVESLSVGLQQGAGLFRLGRDVEASLLMVELCARVQALLEERVELEPEWAHWLTQMLGRQEAQDWLGVADYMEYELVQWLQAAFAA